MLSNNDILKKLRVALSLRNDDIIEINCCNFTQFPGFRERLKAFLTLNREEILEDKPKDEFEYWFHGTDSYGASSIVNIGIDVQKGKPRKDFSDGNGFYLSDNFKAALNWNKKRCDAPYSAILRYKVPKTFLDKKGGLKHSLHNTDEMKTWRKIIRHHLSQKSDEKEMKKYLRYSSTSMETSCSTFYLLIYFSMFNHYN